MRRVVAIANGKGGVGKTSLTAGIAGLAAAAGYRVLAVDTDPQGSLRRDLGYSPEDPSSLSMAIQHGTKLVVQRGIRDRLDVVSGGPALNDVAPMSFSRERRGEALPGLRPVLDQLRPENADGADYDLIVIDTPPGEPVIQDIVFAATEYLIIPTRSDESSLDGLVVVAERFIKARATNPDLQLLGVVLFGVRAGSKRLRDTVREALEDTLEGAAPVFETSIRSLESAAVDMRRHGLLVHELEQDQQSQQKRRLSRLKDRARARGAESRGAAGEQLLNRDASGLAADYADLAREVFTAIAALEEQKAAVAR